MKSKNVIVFFIVFFIIFVSAARAEPELEQLSDLIKHRLNEENAGVGISAAIISGDKVQYLNFGVVDKTAKTKTTNQHLFEIGSITKTFTATALASMIAEGKVKLTDPAQKYLPDSVKLPTFEGKPITLESLANHSSSLPRLPNNMKMADPLNPYADYTIEQLYAFLNDYQLTRAIGSKTEYSNLGTGLLGHILTLIDGKSYEQVITDRVLKPLKMTNTFVNVPMFKQSLVSDGHNGQLQKTKSWQLPILAGAGAIKSNTGDMVKYVQANMATTLQPMAQTAKAV